MQWLPRIARRIRLLIHRSAVERAMDEELRYHIECETSDRTARGMSPDEAARTARRDFGGVEAIKEQARDVRGGRPLEDLALDVRYAVRVLFRNRGFTAAALLTCALGIGAVTAIFSLVYGILLRPLPYSDPDRLVVVWEHNVRRNRDRNVVSLDNYEAWRDRARSFGGTAAIVPTSVTLPLDSGSERLVGADITPGYFTLLGVAPALGRDFLASEAIRGDAVILGEALWRRRFNGDPAILGRSIALSNRPFTVVGVMPHDFDPPRFGWLGDQELWFPFVATPQSRAWGRFLLVVARLRNGVSLEQARAEMVAIASQRADESRANEGWSATVVPLTQQIVGEMEPPLLVLLAATALLIVMAIANVATLTFSLMSRRGHELSVRRAIGATDGRLFRQHFTQSAVLGSAGAALGVALAFPGVRLLVALLPADVPRTGAVEVDGPVLLVATAVAIGATLIFGTIAAARGRRTGAVSPLHRDSTRTTERSAGGTLVSAEIAIAVALGVMAALMGRTFSELRAVDLGFAASGAITARVALPQSVYTTADSQRAFFDRLLERVRALPGVITAGVISTRPFGGSGPATTVRDARRPPHSDHQDPVADVRFADADLFRTLRVRIEQGQLPEWSGAVAATTHAVISASLARDVWPAGDAVGRSLAVELNGGQTATVAAVVGDVHLMDARAVPRPVVYLSASQFPSNVRDLVVRVDGEAEAIVPALRSALARLDPAIPLYAVTTLPDLVAGSLARDRLAAWLLGAFAVSALLLAGIGVFGVFAGDVTRRRKEIGVRLALGAREHRLVLLMLTSAARRASIGILSGTLLAAFLGRGMQSMLFRVSAADPGSFIVVVGVVGTLAAAATLIPTWQALRAAPLKVLRED